LLDPDRANLELETVVLENDAVIVVGLGMNDLAEIQIPRRAPGSPRGSTWPRFRPCCRYDTDLIREVTDPCTGIMTSEKHMSFMLNAGELKVYCEAIAARRERLKRRTLPRFAWPLPRLQMAASRMCSFRKTIRAQVLEVRQIQHGRDGIWVARGVWDPDPLFMSRIGEVAAKVANEATE
jgi:hypothetical protein